MRAIQQLEFGGPEVLRLVDLPVPEPADGEVLIRVRRAGLNFADTHQRENQYVRRASLPLTPGAEVAGVREDTGERVVALCGTGGYAEYAVAPAALTFPIPGGVGSLAVQLGHALGAGRVIATASTEEKRALALDLGADAAVDGAAEGLRERLVEANLGREVDVVLEAIGGEVFEQSLAAL